MAKPPGEFRAVMLGDSVTMGHVVTAAETYSNQLERMIAARRPAGCGAQVINTGVQGYATFQELVLFRESLVFQPDFVSIGFVLNDVTEPWRINRDFGGKGFDYHKITQTGSKAVGYLLNETGWGRLARWVTTIGKSKEAEKRDEVYNVDRLARLGDDDPQLRQAWGVALKDLGEVYAVASRNKVPALLLIFPFTFQFLREDLQEPQRILRAHAEEHGVPSIDFTPVFEALIFGEARDKLRSDPELDKSRLREMVADQIGVYFLDADHLTPEGHRVVAEHLLAYLERQGLLDPQRQACPSAG